MPQTAALYILQTLPKPTDRRFGLREAPVQKVAAVRFAKFSTEATIAAQATLLRRSEILIAVEQKHSRCRWAIAPFATAESQAPPKRRLLPMLIRNLQFAMAFEAQSRRSERFPTSAPHVGPVGVLVIDYKSVRMTHPIAGADSTQRVGMSCWQVRVFVFEDLWVLGRPDH